MGELDVHFSFFLSPLRAFPLSASFFRAAIHSLSLSRGIQSVSATAAAAPVAAAVLLTLTNVEPGGQAGGQAGGTERGPRGQAGRQTVEPGGSIANVDVPRPAADYVKENGEDGGGCNGGSQEVRKASPKKALNELC